MPNVKSIASKIELPVLKLFHVVIHPPILFSISGRTRQRLLFLPPHQNLWVVF